MLIGAIVGLLVVGSGPASPAWPTPAPVSDALTVIMCGVVLGESFDRTQERLGEPSSKLTQGDKLLWVYSVDSGRADCILTISDTRVIQILVSSVNGRPDPQMTDPYGVALGSSTYDLLVQRGDRRYTIESGDSSGEDDWVYPSRSGACWAYMFGMGEHLRDVVVTGIRVFLNLDNPLFDCYTR